MASTARFADSLGNEYTLDDLTADGEGGAVADPADVRILDWLPVGGALTVDLGACGLLTLTRVS